MDVTTTTTPVWHKSSFSSGNGGACVEIAALPDGIGIRDSKDKAGAVLVVEPRAFEEFTRAVAADEFDTFTA